MTRLGLRSRLIVAFVAVSVVAASLVAVVSVVLTRQAMVERATSEAVASTHADLIAAGLAVERSAQVVEDESGRWRVLDETRLERLVEELVPPDGTQVLIIQHGGPDYRTPVAGQVEIPADLQMRVHDGLVAHIRIPTESGDPRLIVGGRVALDALELYRIVDLSPIESDVALVARRAAIAATVPTVLALLVGTSAATQLLRPIRRARNAARRLAAGHLDVRIPAAGNDELAELAAEFNTMADSLEATVAHLQEVMGHQRRFVADVAHELRSPLTALTATVDVLEQEGRADTPDRREATRLVIAEIRGLAAMVEDLMEISRFDAGASELAVHEVSLLNVVEGTLKRRGQTSATTVEIDRNLRVVADPRRLDAIVGNLVGNALSHGQPPVVVRTRMAAEGDLYLEVIDAGPGVPPELREAIFDRFVKASAARTRTEGSGLGLAIARENARLHGGEVTLADTGPHGSVFRCTLPATLLTTTPHQVPS